MAKKIVTIGGGSGMPVINESLLLAGAKNIKSIVTVMDSGGVTGRMRTDSRGQEVAYSDALRTLLSLIPPQFADWKKIISLKEMLRRRNDRGQDLGYTIFSHYFGSENGFGEIQNLLETLTEVKFMGRVLPVTTAPTHLIFKTKSGFVHRGEHELDDKRMSADTVTNIWLEPEVTAFPESVDAVKEADLIIFSCGSFYGSVLVNLLPIGIQQALKVNSGKKAYVTNLASTKNETDKFCPEDFIRLLRKYTRLSKPLDYLIVPNLSRTGFEKKYPQVAAKYNLEHSHFLGWGKDELEEIQKSGVQIITHEALVIDPVLKRLRHDPNKLSQTLKALI